MLPFLSGENKMSNRKTHWRVEIDAFKCRENER